MRDLIIGAATIKRKIPSISHCWYIHRIVVIEPMAAPIPRPPLNLKKSIHICPTTAAKPASITNSGGTPSPQKAMGNCSRALCHIDNHHGESRNPADLPDGVEAADIPSPRRRISTPFIARVIK